MKPSSSKAKTEPKQAKATAKGAKSSTPKKAAEAKPATKPRGAPKPAKAKAEGAKPKIEAAKAKVAPAKRKADAKVEVATPTAEPARETAKVSQIRPTRRLPSVADIEAAAKQGPSIVKILRLIQLRAKLLEAQVADESVAKTG
jgi:hypothetical protein